MELTTMEEGEKRTEKREQENEEKNEKSPLGEEKMRNKSNVENMSQSSRFRIIQQYSQDRINDVGIKVNQNICVSNQNLTVEADQNCLPSSVNCANRFNQFEDDKTLSKKDLLDFGIIESDLKSPFKDGDNVQNFLISMESNIKHNMQPVRGTTFEHTKKDTISDTPVNAKCPKCGSDVSKTEKVLQIPGFKEITILEVSCEYCPHKANNEVKYIGSNSENVKCNGSSHKNYETKGTRISLNVTENDDLKRKLLKSDTCAISIPELRNYSSEKYAYDPYVKNELRSIILDDVFRSNLIKLDNRNSQENLIDENRRPGGNFTTIEGIMVEALENVKTLKSQVHDLENQDINNSSTNNNQNKLKLLNQIEEQITQMKDGKTNFTLIMDDPASNSYLQSLKAPDSDPKLTIEMYERTNEPIGHFGLSYNPSCLQDKPKENVDCNVFMGSPIPKHRRQQQLQESIQGARVQSPKLHHSPIQCKRGAQYQWQGSTGSGSIKLPGPLSEEEKTVDESDDDAWSSSNEANFLMESSKNSYSTTKGSIARGRLGGGHLYTKDTPVLGRRTPQFAGQQQPSPLAASSTGVNGSSNFLAPPQPYYQQLPQSPLATADHGPDSRRPSNAKSVRSITSPASERGRRATIHVMAANTRQGSATPDDGGARQ